MIKSSSNELRLEDVNIIATGSLNAICVENNDLYTQGRYSTKISAEENCYAINMIAATDMADISLMRKTDIVGNIGFTIHNGLRSDIHDNSGVSTINGDLNVVGDKNSLGVDVNLKNVTGDGWTNAGGGSHQPEGGPVYEWNQLEKVLLDEKVTDIILMAPIVFNQGNTINLDGKTLWISDVLFEKYPNATAAIQTSDQLRIENGRIYGPELENPVQKYVVEFKNTSDENKVLYLKEVLLESRAIEYAIFVKDGFFYLEESSIKGGLALKFEAQKQSVKGHLMDSHIEGGVDFVHNHVENDLTFMSGISIEGNTTINGALSREGTYG